MTDNAGYKRPPQSTRFQPGKSGNPTGRPKKVKTVAEELIDELGDKIIVREGGRDVQITKARAIAKEVVRLAMTGDRRAITTAFSVSARHDTDSNQLIEATSADRTLLNSFVEREIRRRTENLKNPTSNPQD